MKIGVMIIIGLMLSASMCLDGKTVDKDVDRYGKLNFSGEYIQTFDDSNNGYWGICLNDSGCFEVNFSETRNSKWGFYDTGSKRSISGLNYFQMLNYSCSEIPESVYICSSIIGCVPCDESYKLGLFLDR